MQYLHRDGAFGEIHGGGRIAEGYTSSRWCSRCKSPTGAGRHHAFDVVVVDEFHHAAAPTIDRLLDHSSPRNYLGSPRRRNARRQGRDKLVRPAGRGRVASMGGDRPGLPGALPVLRRRGRNRPEPSHMAARRLCPRRTQQRAVQRRPSCREALEAVERIVLDPGTMRALGFCVSKEHARYMALKVHPGGLESVALTGDDPPRERDRQLEALRAGRLRWCSP